MSRKPAELERLERELEALRQESTTRIAELEDRLAERRLRRRSPGARHEADTPA